MTQDWPNGALFLYRGTNINAAGISDVDTILTPGVGNEFELHWATISHNDVTASTIEVFIRDPSNNTILELANIASVAQNAVVQVPALAEIPGTGTNLAEPRRIILAGDMDLFLSALLIDDLEGSTVAIVGRVFGGLPDIVVAGGAETVTFEQVL